MGMAGQSHGGKYPRHTWGTALGREQLRGSQSGHMDTNKDLKEEAGQWTLERQEQSEVCLWHRET